LKKQSAAHAPRLLLAAAGGILNANIEFPPFCRERKFYMGNQEGIQGARRGGSLPLSPDGGRKNTEKAAIDLHGLTAEEAEIRLIEFLDGLPGTVKSVEVTHGYKHGTVLKRLVKQDFYHRRLRDKRAGLNPGVTLLLIK
jgi:hypothetical protein